MADEKMAKPSRNGQGSAMSLQSVISAYKRYAHVYDFVFGPIMHQGRKGIVDSMGCRPNDQILEVGVGTGLSLPLYPEHVHVTGIDVSTDMLEKARQRVHRHGLRQIEAICEMDAEQMSFSDDCFDKVVAMYVVSVVPDPIRTVREMQRVCKPDGDIFIVNHFRSRNSLIARFEDFISPLSSLAGFRPDFDLDEFLRSTGLEVVDVRGANLFGYWKVLHCKNRSKAQMAA